MKKSFIVVCLVFVLLAPSARAQSLPDAALEPLKDVEKAVVYSLGDDRNAKDRFHNYPLLGTVTLDGDEAKQAAKVFEDAAAGIPEAIPLCFEPHHALQVTKSGHTYDYLLCYTCAGLRVLEDGKQIAYLGVKGTPDAVNAILAAHQVAIAPTATSEYIEKEHREAEERYQQRVKAEERWKAAMPQSVIPLWSKVVSMSQTLPAEEGVKMLRDVMAVEFPDTRARILALFKWYGSGEGPWSGYPADEGYAEKLLMEYPTADLVAAARQPDLTPQQLEGAARTFGGWEFGRSRPADQKALPADLKSRLLAHVLKTAGNDKDKLGRAKYAFEE